MAGGANRRFGGEPKGLKDVGGKRIVDRVDFEALARLKPRLLSTAHGLFRQKQPALPYGDYAAFCQREAHWLDAYAFYRALKDHFAGRPW